jgi:hypothetical protein
MHVIHMPRQGRDPGCTDHFDPQNRLYCKALLNAQPFSSFRTVVLALLFVLLLHSPFAGAFQVRLLQIAQKPVCGRWEHHMQVMAWQKAWIGLFSNAAALNNCMRLACYDRSDGC